MKRIFKNFGYWGSGLFCLSLLLCNLAAANVTAGSCSLSDIQSAINLAADGDTVMIPAGTCSWTSQLVIDGKAIVVRGAGIDQTIIVDSIPKTGSNQSPLVVNTVGGKRFRLTGLTLRGGDTERGWSGSLIINGTGTDWRIDHVRFELLKSSSVRIYGHTYGVIDHCFFNQDGTQAIVIWHDGWGGKHYGDGSWADSLHLGTNKAVYIEDCTFNNTWAAGSIDSFAGGRFVFRHNTVTNDFIATHGLDSGQRLRGVRSFEIYDNSFTHESLWFTGVFLRGGTGVIFGNTFRNYTVAVTVSNFRTKDAYSPWGKCDGTSPYDGNQEGGYPCLDQVGRSTGTLVSGDNTPTPQAWTEEALEPLYQWNNTVDGRQASVNSDNPNHIQSGRDFYNNVARPNYSPYAYPHPLVSAEQPAPSPPANLRGN